MTENIKKPEKRYPSGFKIKDAKRNGEMIDWNK